MRKQLITLGIVAALVVLVALPASAASRGTSFTPLGLFPLCGTVPEDEFCESFPITTVVSMTADGSTISGMHAFFQGGYLWTEETGLQTVGPIDGGLYISGSGSRVSSDSFDETYSYGYAANWNGLFWTPELTPDDIWTPIPLADGFAFCDFSGQGTFGVSDDWIVGLTWIDRDGNGNGCDGASAFAWSEATGTMVLPNNVNDDSTRANAVSEDGSVIVGWMQTSSREASKWIDGEQYYLCPDPTGAGGNIFCNEGWDVTADGSLMLTGLADITQDFNTRAAIVDQSGNYEKLPFPDAPYDPSWDTFVPRAISDDGNTVVGAFGGGGFFGSPPYPVVWNRDLGMTIDIQVFLLGQGLDDLFFWYLDDATAVNADGTILAGTGINPDGWIEAWKADISRVSVCHKPEGDSNGARRTIRIGWDGVADHLGHGDALSTCEFAQADGHSRAMSGRQAAVVRSTAQDADRDDRVGSMSDVARAQARASESGFGSAVSVTNPYPTTPAKAGAFGETKSVEGGQSASDRELLRQRIERFRQGR